MASWQATCDRCGPAAVRQTADAAGHRYSQTQGPHRKDGATSAEGCAHQPGAGWLSRRMGGSAGCCYRRAGDAVLARRRLCCVLAAHASSDHRVLCPRRLSRFLPRLSHGARSPFPAAVDDALSAYEGRLSRGAQPRELVIAGDSAGGDLRWPCTSRCGIASALCPRPRRCCRRGPTLRSPARASGRTRGATPISTRRAQRRL